jgi:hypothetical protein
MQSTNPNPVLYVTQQLLHVTVYFGCLAFYVSEILYGNFRYLVYFLADPNSSRITHHTVLRSFEGLGLCGVSLLQN